MAWKTVRLSELTVDGKGSYGIAAPAIKYSEAKPTYLRITDINDDGTINFEGLKSVEAQNSSNYVLKENDIVFARTGASTGRTYFYQKQDGQFVYAGFLIKFSLDPKKVNPRFLKYYTHSKVYYDWIHSFNNGATRGNINAKTFGDMVIKLPDRIGQDNMVSILSSLDDKIECNQRICRNLEEQAQALFKHWFIDFTPFRNTPFIDSPLGPIPLGWRTGTLGEIVTQVTEKVGARDGVRVFSAVSTGNLVLSDDFFRKQVYSKSISKYITVAPDDFAYNPACVNIGSIGRNEFDYMGCVSPVYVVFRCAEHYHYFIDFIRGRKAFKRHIEKLAIGGVRQTLRFEDLARIPLVIPTENAVKSFNAIYDNLYRAIKHLSQESTRLATLRDTLLPKLMSGEIKG